MARGEILWAQYLGDEDSEISCYFGVNKEGQGTRSLTHWDPLPSSRNWRPRVQGLQVCTGVVQLEWDVFLVQH